MQTTAILLDNTFGVLTHERLFRARASFFFGKSLIIHLKHPAVTLVMIFERKRWKWILAGFRSCYFVVSPGVSLNAVNTREKRGYPKGITIRDRLLKSHKSLRPNTQSLFLGLVDQSSRSSLSTIPSQSCSNHLQHVLRALREPACKHGANNSFHFTQVQNCSCHQNFHVIWFIFRVSG